MFQFFVFVCGAVSVGSSTKQRVINVLLIITGIFIAITIGGTKYLEKILSLACLYYRPHLSFLFICRNIFKLELHSGAVGRSCVCVYACMHA